MKLKLIVASMSVLGLISCPVLAADTQAQTQATQATQTQATQPAPAEQQTVVKHKHHHHHHKMAAQTAAKRDYKDYKDMAALPVEVCPTVNNYTMVLDSMSQNVGRAKSTIHCMDPISFAGGINFDSHWGQRNAGYAGENTRRLSLNDAYVNIYGNVNDWVKAFASLSYSGFNGVNETDENTLNGLYSNAYTPDTLTLEQGYITFGNFNVSPFFVRLGKEFEDFGRYQIHPITETLAQTLTESLHTTAQAGFITQMGLSGSLYTYNNLLTKVSDSHEKNVWGASLGFAQPSDQLGWDIGAGFMSNFTGVNDVGYAVGLYNGSSGGTQSGNNGTYIKTVGAGSLYGDVNSGPFSLGLRYVSALQSFNVADLGTGITPASSAHGAKPWAGDITGGYGFNAWGKDQNVYLGYQASGDAVNIFLPKSRWMAGYGIDMWKNTNLGAQINHDTAYSQGSGGTGNSSNTVAVRAAVKFG